MTHPAGTLPESALALLALVALHFIRQLVNVEVIRQCRLEAGDVRVIQQSLRQGTGYTDSCDGGIKQGQRPETGMAGTHTHMWLGRLVDAASAHVQQPEEGSTCKGNNEGAEAGKG